MCVSYMRKLAIRKASAMLRSMPSAIVMADANLNIIETNEAFVRMFAPDLLEIFKDRPEGACRRCIRSGLYLLLICSNVL